jgi:hypothetical protein
MHLGIPLHGLVFVLETLVEAGKMANDLRLKTTQS